VSLTTLGLGLITYFDGCFSRLIFYVFFHD